MENFKEGISGTASITKSTSDKESIDVEELRSDRALSACSCVIRSLDTSLASNLSGKGRLGQYPRQGRQIQGAVPANLRPLSIEA